jgi:hypothetical protein
MKIRKTLNIDDDAMATLRWYAKLNRITLTAKAEERTKATP